MHGEIVDPMTFLEPTLKRNRGWPWPEESLGLSEMVGDTGWCHTCGIPLVGQTGSLTLQVKGMKAAEGAWVPYWRYDSICIAEPLAAEALDRFGLEGRKIAWRWRTDQKPSN